ncbi:MAG: hypothetical protein Ct9H300mP30_3300 [Methanobacteriota archaeon]|nr:MAG: hypothetical protein Ct9H300mP30_3300 [Euryarchaeota archaeon]
MTIAMLMMNTVRAGPVVLEHSQLEPSVLAGVDTGVPRRGGKVRFTWTLPTPSVARAERCTADIISGGTGHPGLVRVMSISACAPSSPSSHPDCVNQASLVTDIFISGSSTSPSDCIISDSFTISSS